MLLTRSTATFKPSHLILTNTRKIHYFKGELNVTWKLLGEAINRIMKIDPDFPINNAKKIIGLRNQIIHAYDNISNENIWVIVLKHIPLLDNEVNQFIIKIEKSTNT